MAQFIKTIEIICENDWSPSEIVQPTTGEF